jgi:hypothetical protein
LPHLGFQFGGYVLIQSESCPHALMIILRIMISKQKKRKQTIDQDMETFLLSHNPRFLKLIGDSAESVRKSGSTSLSDLVEEMKASRRSTRKRKKVK